MTSLPPTLSSLPTSHSIWIEIADSSLPEGPTIVSRGPSLDFGPAELSCDTIVVGGLLLFRPSIAASSGAAASASCSVPRAGPQGPGTWGGATAQWDATGRVYSAPGSPGSPGFVACALERCQPWISLSRECALS